MVGFHSDEWIFMISDCIANQISQNQFALKKHLIDYPMLVKHDIYKKNTLGYIHTAI